MRNKEYKAISHIGPGGIKCVCCGPAPGKDRKEFRRRHKRRLRQKDRKALAEYLK